MILKKFITLVGDIIGLYLALIFSLALRYRGFNSEILKTHLPYFSVVFLLWLIVFYIYNLDDLDIVADRAKFFMAFAGAMIVNVLLSIAFFYLAPQFSAITIAPKAGLFLIVLVGAILICVWRYLIHWLWSVLGLKTNIAMLGYSPEAIKLAEEIVKKPHLGYNLKFILKEGSIHSSLLSHIDIKQNFKNIENDFRDHKIQLAVLSPEIYRSIDLIQALFDCMKHGVEFISIPDFYERLSKTIPIQAINRFWFLENISQRQRHKRVHNFLKRTFDLVLALLLLIVLSPLWILIALIIMITSSGPVIYTQTRMGFEGRPFKVFKFRSIISSGSFKPNWFGRILQKTRLDEIPQLINIIRGEMSFVGPMAEKLELHENLETNIPFFRERYLVKPGITGWAQIKYGYTQSIEDNLERIQYDLYYIKNRSLILDMEILLKTLSIILRGGGN